MLHNTGISSDPALSGSEAQPAWLTLNEARERAFTGEIVFETEPEVTAYLDNGVVYYAERASDVSLARRLVEAGLVDTIQLERGIVRVGDVEHLGRLFDREPSVDRDAVLVMTETATEELISDIANHVVTRSRATAYRHHPSGLHRWFVAPIESSPAAWPLSGVAPLGSGLVDDLPGLGIGAHELIIEWDDPIETLDDLDTLDACDDDPSVDDFSALVLSVMRDEEPPGDTRVDTDRDSGRDAVRDAESFELSLDLVEFIDDTHVDGVAATASEELVPEEDEFDFSIFWPGFGDGASSQPTFEFEPTLADVGDTADDTDQVADDVADDVADAVRRAIAAIESATIDTPVADDVSVGLWNLDEIDGETDEIDEVDEIDEQHTAESPAFAPPSLNTRAEVLYSQLEAELAASSTMAAEVVDDPTGSDDHGDSDERSSALRRLIGSLRRKDH